MAADFSKIINHPDKDRIITKLVGGDPPKTVSEFLKFKYDDPGESHLRLPINLLTEFKDKYLDRYKFLEKVVKDQQDGKLDKKIADSLLNNKSFRDRLAELADEKIDLKKKIVQVLAIIEQRAEQVFDAIQQNPSNFKGDYVLIKYLELLVNAVEKGDKVINERPDMLIQHNISIQLIEQHSLMFQEAIRETLKKFDPEVSVMFMDLLTQKLAELQPDGGGKHKLEDHLANINKMLPAEIVDAAEENSEDAEFEDTPDEPEDNDDSDE